MGRRIDYYDDPNAPAANSLVPSVNVVVENDKGEILMIRRTDNDNWALPGGAIDLGESVTQAAIRETKEETGIDVEITGLVGIYSDPKHLIHYTSNNEVRQEFSIVLRATLTGGELRLSAESAEVCWISRSRVNALHMHDSMRFRVHDSFLIGSMPVIS
ncbi:NUDIX hydrolase [Actinomadura geliboluensis]